MPVAREALFDRITETYTICADLEAVLLMVHQQRCPIRGRLNTRDTVLLLTPSSSAIALPRSPATATGRKGYGRTAMLRKL